MEPPPEAPEGVSKDPRVRVPELRQPAGKSNPNTFCKALIIVALLLVVPLFPSRAPPPEFVGQGNFNGVWEIFHIIVFGIAVSYGLFCRMTTDRVVDRERVGNGDSDGYLSGIFQLSSVFEGEVDNIRGVDEQDVMRVYGNCECLMKSDDLVLGQNKCAIHGNVAAAFSNMSQAWCSQYLKGESLVVVSNGKDSVGGDTDYKPLNLPVRSLRSGRVENEKGEIKGGYNFSLEGESMSNDDIKVVKIRGVVPVNLEKKFDEVAGQSSIPWRSKSGRMMGIREGMNYERANAHCRPHSVGEIEFDHINSGPFLGLAEMQPPITGKCGEEKAAPVNSDGSFHGGKMRLLATVNRGEEKVAVLYGDALFRGEEDELGKGKLGVESLESDISSSSPVNVLSKAKSVRTVKPRRYIAKHDNGRVFKTYGSDSMVKRGSQEEAENHSGNHWNHELDSVKPSLDDEQSVSESEQELGNEVDNRSVEENAKTYLEIDSEVEGSEVDRKAGEFIAKFREQIRLQKASSAEG